MQTDSQLSAIQGIHADTLFIAKAMDWLKISSDDVMIPGRFERIKEIIEFLQSHPNPSGIVAKCITGKNVDPVDHMYAYANLSKQKAEVDAKLDTSKSKVEALMRSFDAGDEALLGSFATEHKELLKASSQLGEELSFYER